MNNFNDMMMNFMIHEFFFIENDLLVYDKIN